MRNRVTILALLLLVACSSEDKQDLSAAAPKQIELNLHFPIPVEPWDLPPE
jgi:uncharacterized protein YcfL